VLGECREFRRLIEQAGASDVVVAITKPERIDPALLRAIIDCHEQGIQITEMPVLYEQLTRRVPVEYVGRNLHVVLPLKAYPPRSERTLKRLFDIIIGILGLFVTALLIPWVWLGSLVDRGGSIFYRQVRIGRGGKPFQLMKFRTMVPEAEADGPQWADEDDGRVTRTGRIVRRLHLDEIPQAINIIRGELSFIGPRPERPEFVAQLEPLIPFYRARHAIRPGVTGWAQVCYGYGASVEDTLIKVQYDLYYIKHQSLWLDLVILMKTIGLVLTLRGR